MAKYTAEELRVMLAKGQAMKNPAGDPSYPVADEEDLQAAVHAVGRGGASANAIRKYIMGRAKSMGKSTMIPDTWQSDGSLNADSGSSTRTSPFTRSFVLDDISVRTEGGGRTVDAYAAVFDTPAAVHDPDGDYEEVIDRGAFNRTLEHNRRSRGGMIPVLFNHGMTLFGTPSERYSIPIGVSEEIRPDNKGLFTRSKFHRSAAADEVLEAIRDGSITSYSFRGEFMRSDPIVPRRGFRKDAQGRLPTVRRMESSLMEYGPGTFTVYKDATIVGVRAEQAALLLNSLAPGELDRLTSFLRSDTHADPSDLGTPSDEDPASDDPPLRHSTRTPKQEAQARRADFIIRHGGEHA